MNINLEQLSIAIIDVYYLIKISEYFTYQENLNNYLNKKNKIKKK